jgi:ATP-dependent protease Clp ATPase subunit
MSIVCDMCQRKLYKSNKKYIESKLDENKKHICEDCIKLCKKIIDDPKQGNIIFFNYWMEQSGEK